MAQFRHFFFIVCSTEPHDKGIVFQKKKKKTKKDRENKGVFFLSAIFC